MINGNFCCILSCSYIKPQPASKVKVNSKVVYYHVPTSNHNNNGTRTNENGLYIIMFLHQTTTALAQYHATIGCILSCSYIKPQLRKLFRSIVRVVYYHVPTSNHNRPCPESNPRCVVYYHVPTSNHNWLAGENWVLDVVYYHVPTSNHNYFVTATTKRLLYIIMFLHQTTTIIANTAHTISCILSCSYIKPQLKGHNISLSSSCILSCSYIKPQPIVSKLLTIRKKQSISLIRNGYVGNIFMQIY